MNAINVINPYRWQGGWVFDDESKGLDKEPFIAGADTMLDMLSGDHAECVITFSAKQFPGAEHVVKYVKPEMDGSVYHSDEYNHDLWLCPALLKYFETPPEEIWFQFKAK